MRLGKHFSNVYKAFTEKSFLLSLYDLLDIKCKEASLLD